MMAEIKRGMKLLKYGYGFKFNIVVSVVVFLLGILMLCIGENGLLMGTLYIVLGPTMLLQLESSLLYSGMVAGSSQRRLLELTLPNFLTIVTGLLGYVVMVGAAWSWAIARPEQIATCMEMTLASGIMIAMILIYFGTVIKYFFTSVVMFALGLMLGIVIGMVTIRLAGEYLNMFSVSLLCLALVVIGMLVSCRLRRAFYRKQISPMAGGWSLRKAMQ